MPRRSTPHYAAYYRWLVIREHILAHIGLTERLLDVGSDDGFVAGQIPAKMRYAIDLSPRAPDRDVVTPVCASATAIPFPPASFDTILAIDILEHVADDAAMTREMMRTLAPGGRIWFSTPASGWHIFPRFLTARANRAFGHVRDGYTRQTIAALISGAPGWQVRWFHWNEPVLRKLFVVLRLIQTVSPVLALKATGMCFALDKSRDEGGQGHMLGCICRASNGAALPAKWHVEQRL
jgi:SAM-dependent methyltransferase